MAIKIHLLTLGMVSTNCYILGDEKTAEAVIVDPSAEAPKILEVIEREGWTVRAILLTHSHFDHVLALGEVKAATSAPYYIHQEAIPFLENLPETVEQWLSMTVPPAPLPPDHLIDEGDEITVGDIKLEVLYTPGHAPGHVSYVFHDEAVVFSGDCLFQGSIGRTDLPGGDHPTLMRSIFSKLLTLPEDYTVAAGHMQTTTIARERATNPFLLDFLDHGFRE